METRLSSITRYIFAIYVIKNIQIGRDYGSTVKNVLRYKVQIQMDFLRILQIRLFPLKTKTTVTNSLNDWLLQTKK